MRYRVLDREIRRSERRNDDPPFDHTIPEGPHQRARGAARSGNRHRRTARERAAPLAGDRFARTSSGEAICGRSLSVHDAGPCFEEPSAAAGDPFAESGRGMPIVRALSDDVRIRRIEPRGCVVSAALRLTKRPDRACRTDDMPARRKPMGSGLRVRARGARTQHVRCERQLARARRLTWRTSSSSTRSCSARRTKAFCSELTRLSSAGWQVAGLTHGPDGLICLLRREKDFEVAQSLQVAFEESETLTEAISRREIPPEEMTP